MSDPAARLEVGPVPRAELAAYLDTARLTEVCYVARCATPECRARRLLVTWRRTTRLRLLDARCPHHPDARLRQTDAQLAGATFVLLTDRWARSLRTDVRRPRRLDPLALCPTPVGDTLGEDPDRLEERRRFLTGVGQERTPAEDAELERLEHELSERGRLEELPLR